MTGSVGAALARAAERLARAGIDGAARDARRLMAGALEIEAARVALIAEEPLPPGAAAAFEAMVARRVAREPVARILGRRAFWGHTFRVTPDVLDPRPETETLVARAFDRPFGTVLDLGTGSGAILLSLLAGRPGATGTGTDVSDLALDVARANARDLGLAGRARFVAADWWADVEERYDLIVSNPPYIAADEIAGLSPEVRDHDPRGALTDGGDGLAAYRAIADGAAAHLAADGRILVEIGPAQGSAVSAIFAARGLDVAAVHPDLDGRDRVVEAREIRKSTRNSP